MIRWFSMLAGWLICDILWWIGADRRLHAIRGALAWRVLLALFVVAQISFIAMMTIGTAIEHVPDVKPMLWPVAAYIWHLFVLPSSVLVWLGARGVTRLRKKPAKP